MSKLFASVAALAMLTALADPVQAETVNGWRVEYWPDASAGACSAKANYPRTKTELFFIRMYNAENGNASEWGIMLSNDGWKTKGNTYQVIIETEGRGQPKKTLVKEFRGLDGGGIVHRGLTIEEMNYLAFEAEASVRFINKRDNKVIAHLRIDNSAAPIRAVVHCLKARAPVVAKTEPTTTPKKEVDSHQASFGTGFFVAPKYVLTAYHVVEKCDGNKIFIKYPTYRSEKAILSGYDKKNDLALLKTDMNHMGIAKFRLRGRLGEQVAS
jgi:hypothetical protein